MLCATFVEKTTAEVVSGSAHTGSAASGKSTHGNSLSVDAADEPSTAVKNVKRVLGAVIDSGVSLLRIITVATVGRLGRVSTVIGIARIITIIITEWEMKCEWIMKLRTRAFCGTWPGKA